MTGPGGFADHFSAGASGYASFRPTYPVELFDWLAAKAPARDLAWDCATGSGQAAAGLARHFSRVIATDASAAQLENARPLPNVEYRVAPAEASGLPDRTADLITVAQALHWLDLPRFFAEVGRVGRHGAVLACWMYDLPKVVPAVDRWVTRLYSEIVGPFWPANRELVEKAYRSIDIPFPPIESPPFAMTANWTLAHLLGYLRTWSAAGRYTKAKGEDPVALVSSELAVAWGDPGSSRTVTFPLVVRAAKVG